VKQEEILDWAIAGVVAKMQNRHWNKEQRTELKRKLNHLARLYVVEKEKRI